MYLGTISFFLGTSWAISKDSGTKNPRDFYGNYWVSWWDYTRVAKNILTSQNWDDKFKLSIQTWIQFERNEINTSEKSTTCPSLLLGYNLWCWNLKQLNHKDIVEMLWTDQLIGFWRSFLSLRLPGFYCYGSVINRELFERFFYGCCCPLFQRSPYIPKKKQVQKMQRSTCFTQLSSKVWWLILI